MRKSKNRLPGEINRALRLLKRGVGKEAGTGGTAEWLSDNYYLLEREARQAQKELSEQTSGEVGVNGLPALYNDCAALCENGILPDNDALIEHFGKKSLSSSEACTLKNMLRCALLIYAADGEDDKTRSNAVRSLRAMADIDFAALTAVSSPVERILLKDPAELYGESDEVTREIYRAKIAKKAGKTGIDEEILASRAVEAAARGKTPRERHVGAHIMEEKKHPAGGWLLFVCEALTAIAVSAVASYALKKWWMIPVLLLPVREIIAPPLERLFLKKTAPEYFPRLEEDSETVRRTHTLITLSVIMPTAEECGKLAERLAAVYCANRAPGVRVCCLADLKGAASPTLPEDSSEINAMRREIDRLNKKYSGGFILAVRPRSFSKTQREFIGKNRKRGAITELVRAIKDEKTSFSVLYGDLTDFHLTDYLLALDSDTGTAFDAVRRLVAVAAHPLNRPVVSGGRVVKGFGILLPCVRTKIPAGEGTLFRSFIAGSGGVSVYDALSGEKYQDLFGESVFTGKGLIDVDAFYKVASEAFPGERVLSHDVLEGNLLRTGYVSDIQLTEGFPSKQSSYLTRLNRWVRGDWQNAPLIFGRNPMNALSRYKLLDNLRRSLTPAVALVGVVLSILMPEKCAAVTVAAVLLSSACGELFAFFHSLADGGLGVLTGRYYSKALPSAMQLFAGAFASAAMLPAKGWYSLDAIARSLWRMNVSKKRLLQWTTADQSERGGSTYKELKSCIPSLAAGLLLLIFGGSVGRFAGIVFLSDLPFALYGARKTEKPVYNPDGAQRERLLSYAAGMWAFFEDNCTAQNNYLPPDNVQESPVKAVAARTSPTNIGLMLTSCLAARDLGFIDSARLFEFLDRSLKSVEKLEKYRGNLLNWYSTETLEPLKPKFVSTVDSGNFLCCLVALRQGLKEYVHECGELAGIMDRITALLDSAQLDFLYNPRRRLFSIGCGVDGRTVGNYYDLFMSEARMTAYYAVARRIVPPKHWGAMGRIPVKDGGYTGLVSWTGTMFEYFMPHIFIPSPPGSLCYEALKFCLRCQRKKTAGGVWGCSESGFYAFDGELNYQYKAHGAGKLGLKRGLDRETVISPYSSFLTLTTAPAASLGNLRRLERLGMLGRYGFYEAIDMTRGSAEGAVVASFMAHHVGMSLLSVVNTLKENVFQRRFMSDDDMSGAKSLLWEKIPTGVRVFKDIDPSRLPKPHERTRRGTSVSETPDVFAPKARIYSNGRWTLEITDSGAGTSTLDGADVTCRCTDPVTRPNGVLAVFESAEGIIPFFSCLDIDGRTKYSVRFGEKEAVYRARNGDTSLKAEVCVLRDADCELRRFTVENLGSAPLEGVLKIYLEPCLAPAKAFTAHPAFSRLFIESMADDDNRLLLFDRSAREGENPMGMAVGFLEDTEAGYSVSREAALRCGDGVFSLALNSGVFDNGTVSGEPCAAFGVRVKLGAGERLEKTLLLSAADSASGAAETILTLRGGTIGMRRASDLFFGGSLVSALAGGLLPAVLFTQCGHTPSEDGEFSLADLWSFGISGDYPVIIFHLDSAENIAQALPYIRVNRLLRSRSVLTELAIIFEETDGYNNPIFRAIKEALKSEDCELMLGVSGGVHAVNSANHSPRELAALRAACVYDSGRVKNVVEQERYAGKREMINRSLPLPVETQSEKSDKEYNFTDGEIRLRSERKPVDIPWTLVLANKSFGAVVSDKSLGFTWALNSRENKLTPWYNDSRSDNRGELLTVKINGKIYDIILGSEAVFTPEKALWRSSAEGITFKTEVTVPKTGMTKKIQLNMENTTDCEIEISTAYFCSPVCGEKEGGAVTAVRSDNGRAVLFSNRFAPVGGWAALSADAADALITDRDAFLKGCREEAKRSSAPCAAVVRNSVLRPGEQGKVCFYLSWGRTREAALAMPHVSTFGDDPVPVKVNTAVKEIDLLFNSFLYHQVKNSRFFGRTGFWQCGGAYGFRDQLQDCLALLYGNRRLVRTHLLRSAAVQFVQGDVLHWWHVIPDGKTVRRGIRTRCSDDMLWLPFVTAEYVRKTGDEGILGVNVPFLEGEELNPGENERYFVPGVSTENADLLEHCVRAVKRVCKFGEHGLPLIGTGDWNDGFDRLGAAGHGESVWLAEFLCLTAGKTADLCDLRGRAEDSVWLREVSRRMAGCVSEKAFDGTKFVRAFDDLGRTVGGGEAVDILPQAFASFAGIGSREMRLSALNCAADRLVDTEHGIVKLLTPSFSHSRVRDVGYVAAYPQGVRENGGQYTHAAVWLALAFFNEGERERGTELLKMLSPVGHDTAVYRGEPYVLAGDVNGGTDPGRAGWTQYTGAAAWYYIAALEQMAGVVLSGGELKNTAGEKNACKGENINKPSDNG